MTLLHTSASQFCPHNYPRASLLVSLTLPHPFSHLHPYTSILASLSSCPLHYTSIPAPPFPPLPSPSAECLDTSILSGCDEFRASRGAAVAAAIFTGLGVIPAARAIHIGYFDAVYTSSTLILSFATLLTCAITMGTWDSYVTYALNTYYNHTSTSFDLFGTALALNLVINIPTLFMCQKPPQEGDDADVEAQANQTAAGEVQFAVTPVQPFGGGQAQAQGQTQGQWQGPHVPGQQPPYMAAGAYPQGQGPHAPYPQGQQPQWQGQGYPEGAAQGGRPSQGGPMRVSVQPSAPPASAAAQPSAPFGAGGAAAAAAASADEAPPDYDALYPSPSGKK